MQTLKTVRDIVEHEHALELERAARVAPLTFSSVTPLPGRSVVLRGEAGPADPSAGFAPGDGVEVVGRDGGPATFGSVVTVDPDGVVVELSGTRLAALPPSGVLRLRVDDNQRTIRLRALERVVRERHTLRWVGPVLTGAVPAPSTAAPRWEPDEASPLTEGQARALAGATASADVFLIQGPPGTGKTTVIAELLRFLAHARGARVLLSSRGHRAIDNALDRLDGIQLQVLRLGQSSKVTGAGQDRLLSEVVRQAEAEIPPRQAPMKNTLADYVQALAEVVPALAQLDNLYTAIAAGDAAITERLAEIDAWHDEAQRLLASRRTADEVVSFANWRGVPRAWVSRLFGRAAREARDRRALDRLEVRHREVLERADFAHLRAHVAGLRDELARQLADVPSLPRTPEGLPEPCVCLIDSNSVRASLGEVRQAQAQLELALPALQAWWALLDEPDGLARCVVSNTDVIAATAIGVDSGRDGARIAELDFDVAIIDEASQAHLMDLVVPLSRSRSVILVGDHRQLPPYLDEELRERCAAEGLSPEWLEASVFELLWDRVPASHRARLDVQFRMPSAIADFLGNAFYEGGLASAPWKQREQQWKQWKQHGPPLSDLFAAAVVFVDTSDDPRRLETALPQGFLNRCEAELCAQLGAALPADRSLGVIAPYAAQVGAIRQSLARARGLPVRDAWLIDNVATVDSFQGQERDVVIVSLTRSNRDGAVGFVSDLNRLNVTLSRAREQLVIVGDLSTLSADSTGRGARREAFATFMGDLVEHLSTQGEVISSDGLRARLADG